MYDRLQSLHTEAAGQCPGLVSRPALLLLLFSLAAGEAWEVRQTAGTGRGGGCSRGCRSRWLCWDSDRLQCRAPRHREPPARGRATEGSTGRRGARQSRSGTSWDEANRGGAQRDARGQVERRPGMRRGGDGGGGLREEVVQRSCSGRSHPLTEVEWLVVMRSRCVESR